MKFLLGFVEAMTAMPAEPAKSDHADVMAFARVGALGSAPTRSARDRGRNGRRPE